MSLAHNIWKLYLIKISKWFMVFMPILVLFMQDNGLSLQAVMTIQAIYSLGVAVFEIPSGYFSDRLGRKRSLLVGTVLITGQFVGYSLATGFWGLALGAVVGGLGASFISGTDSALLYDSLQALGRSGDYLKWEGRSYAIGTFAEAVAAIVGGSLAYCGGLRAPIVAQVGISAIGVVAALLLVEPPRTRTHNRTDSEQLRYILRYLFLEQKKLRLFIGLATIFSLASLLLAWFAQPYFEYYSLPEYQIGYLWAGLNGVVALFALTAHRTTSKIPPFGLVAVVLLGFAGGYAWIGSWGGAQLWWGVGAMVVLYALRGVASPSFLTLINQEAPDDMRATILSIRGFITRIGYAFVAPLLGWVADVYSIVEAFWWAGLTLGIMSVVALLGYAWMLRQPAPPKK